MNKKNILIFLSNGERRLFMSNPRQTEEEQLLDIKSTLEKNGTEVSHHLLISPNDLLKIDLIDHVEPNKHGFLRLNIEGVVSEKMEEVRLRRTDLFKTLDVDSLIAMEDDNNEKLSKIVTNKKFLRDIPQVNKLRFLNKSEDILNCNLFNNVLFVRVTNPGKGYASPPEVSISSPVNEKFIGFQAKAVAEMEGGRVSRVKIIDPGSNYISEPTVTISPPENSNGTNAKARAELVNRVERES